MEEPLWKPSILWLSEKPLAFVKLIIELPEPSFVASGLYSPTDASRPIAIKLWFEGLIVECTEYDFRPCASFVSTVVKLKGFTSSKSLIYPVVSPD